MKGQDI